MCAQEDTAELQATADAKPNLHHHPAGILHSRHGTVPKHPANPSPASLSSFWLPGSEPRDRDRRYRKTHMNFPANPILNLADYKNYVKKECEQRAKAVTSILIWTSVPSGRITKVWGDAGEEAHVPRYCDYNKVECPFSF